MTLFRHIAACNQFEMSRFLPLRRDGERIGWVRSDRVTLLRERPDLFGIADMWIDLVLPGPAAKLSAALAGFIETLVAEDAVPPLRHEAFAVSLEWLGEPLFTIDRAAVPFFGTRSYGVHMNGLRRPDASELWIGKRAKDKRVAPGKLDNLVAGGIGAGYDAAETLIKEAGEEAGIDAALAAQARPVSAIVYRMEVPEGVRDDVLLVYDLLLPADFEPRAVDGEFEAFSVISLDRCLQLVRNTDDFKFNVNLVLIDLALRHGAIGPDDPEYLSLMLGLRGNLVGKTGAASNFGG